MRKNLKLGVFGFGCVGQGLYHVLHETKGVKAEIKKICIKNLDKQRTLPAEFFTTSKEELLRDPEIDVIVELIDDASAAFEIVKASLQNGKAVVTANKRMLAEHLKEIYELQQRYKRPVLYEGAVCGSIPIIRNLEEYYDNDMIKRVEGIFNGSTNYILTKVLEEGNSYSDALQEAQTLGFAESDPRFDVQAFDSAFKLAILVVHAFGIFVRPENIIRFGIERISAVDLKYAKYHDLSIKLVARAFKSGNNIYALVAPQFVDTRHSLHTVRNEFNAVLIEGAFAEEQLFVGKGAGGYPTGSAVLSDISALRYDYGYEYRKLNQENQVSFSNEAVIDVVVSFSNDIQISTDKFIRFDGGLHVQGQQSMHGLASLGRIKQWSGQEGISVIVKPGAVLEPLVVGEKKVLNYA